MELSMPPQSHLPVGLRMNWQTMLGFCLLALLIGS
jgi:hypothetical protein